MGVLLALVVYVLKERAWRMVPTFALLLVMAWGTVAWPVHHWAGALKPSAKASAQASPSGTAQPSSTPAPVLPKGTAVPKATNVEIDRIKSTFGSDTMERSRVGGRLYVIKKGFEIAKDHPWIGRGFGTFGDSATKSYPSPIYYHYQIKKPLYADNQYIMVIVETGALGAVAFGLFLIGLLVEAIRARRLAVLGGLGLGLVAAAYWFGFIYNIWEDKVFALYFYVILGYIVQQVAVRRTVA
jgi:O-antigen ligase